MSIINKLRKLFHVHKYTWTKETRDWFFTGEKKGHIGSKCVKCGELSDKL